MTISKEQYRKIYKDLEDEAYNLMQDILENESELFPEIFTDRAGNLYADPPNIEYTKLTFYDAIEMNGVLEVACLVNGSTGDKKLNNLIDQMDDIEDKIIR